MKIVYNTILFTLLFLATSCDHSEKIDDIKLEISQNIFRNIDNNGGKITVAITSKSGLTSPFCCEILIVWFIPWADMIRLVCLFACLVLARIFIVDRKSVV